MIFIDLFVWIVYFWGDDLFIVEWLDVLIVVDVELVIMEFVIMELLVGVCIFGEWLRVEVFVNGLCLVLLDLMNDFWDVVDFYCVLVVNGYLICSMVDCLIVVVVIRCDVVFLY